MIVNPVSGGITLKEITQKITLRNSIQLPDKYKPQDVLFFDIETTGFAPATTILYLIGCVYYENDSYYIKQWFADTADAQTDVLSAFLSFTRKYKYLIHYNGNGFDIPYIIKKCHLLKIECDFSHIKSFDIYKEIQPLKALLKLDNLKQKTIEQFLNINREDRYSGGELIQFYNNYLKSPDEQTLEILLLHNHDDIVGMTRILPVLRYLNILNGNYSFNDITINDVKGSRESKKEVTISLKLPKIVPVRISYGKDSYYLTAYNDIVKICINVYTEELKFFYPNYKDYYYLPEEDCALHKSVAFYVDKNFRTKAKAANCYSKKTGTFLPQIEEIIKPYFKIEYEDKITYFEYTEDFYRDGESIKKYCGHIIKYMER